MENYIVSARKYRPSTFDSVVGQRSLTTTLKNAIASGKLAHAYLFCGPRGVGKTTCARIFAKTINCLHPTADGEACNECESCKAFNEQRSYNIHELDAASNNLVENIRSLIEQVRIPPQIGRYKVFIIDEVHMLSSAAFNAFLKTLEEPPAHAIFILATTEKHKILPTILSRCQIYDFNRMNVNDMVKHLEYVAQKEGIKYEPEALNVIAQKADGGMRDALSIFDQVVSFTEGNIEYQKVIENLNVLDYDYYFKLTDCFLANKVPDVMLLFNEILNKGFEAGHFITGMASHFRDLLVSRDAATLPLLEVGDQIKARYQEQAQKCPEKFLYRAMKLCNDCDLAYRASKNKRLLVEITLIQVAQLTQEADDAGNGLRPTKKLKPLFKQQVASPQPTANGHVAATKPAPQATASVAPVRTAPQSANTNGTRSTPLPAEQKESAKITTIQRGQGIGLSIRGLAKKENEVVAKPSAEPSVAVATSTDNAENAENVENTESHTVSEKEIVYYWREYANLLPQADKAMAGRMQILTPQLIEKEEFEVLVDNEQVRQYMQQEAPKIEAHLQRQLHNNHMKMRVRVAEQGEVERAYTSREMFDMMSKENPTLLKLTEEFGLELS